MSFYRVIKFDSLEDLEWYNNCGPFKLVSRRHETFQSADTRRNEERKATGAKLVFVEEIYDDGTRLW
jgi:hypothetical protein